MGRRPGHLREKKEEFRHGSQVRVTSKGHRSDLGSQIRVSRAPYKAGLAGTKFLVAGQRMGVG